MKAAILLEFSVKLVFSSDCKRSLIFAATCNYSSFEICVLTDDKEISILAKVFEEQAEKDRETRRELMEGFNRTLKEGFSMILAKPPVVIKFGQDNTEK